MSTRQNDEWLEAAQDDFEAAVLEENWSIAHAIIGGLREAGFDSEARVLEKELAEKLNEV